jgi:periplasmic protein TonB
MGEPKFDVQPSTFRWNVSIVSAPAPEPVTSDVPIEVRSASSPKPELTSSPNVYRNVSKESSNPSSLRQQKPNQNFSQQSAVGPPIKKSYSKGHKYYAVSGGQGGTISGAGMTASHIQPEKQEAHFPTPFAQGEEAAPPPPIEKVVKQAEQVRQPSIVEIPKVLHRPRPYQRQVRSREVRPDYGWLVDDLRVKLEQFKFYPQMARLNKWEGKVVIQMKILDSGQLIEAQVEESSGFDVLDQTALAIVRRASPLELDYPLMANNVVLSVPLTFQLE